MPKDQKVNMKVREDFLLVALHALLRIAAEVVLKDQGPISDVKELAQSIADQFVSIERVYKWMTNYSCTTLNCQHLH